MHTIHGQLRLNNSRPGSRRLAMWACIAIWALGLSLLMLSGGQAAVELVEFTATTQADGSILLRWVTRWELDTSAFRIYRALTRTGPWDTMIHEQMSTSDGESDTVYEYLDSDVEPGKTYYYLLEEVEVESVGGVNRYMDFIRSATAGQPGAPTFTPTATHTRTATATQIPASPTSSPTATPTPTATFTPTDVSASAPTATRQFTNTPVPPASPTATRTPSPTTGTTALATATPRPSATVAAPTGQPGQPRQVVSPTATAVRSPTVVAVRSPTPAIPATPPGTAGLAPIPEGVQTPIPTPTLAVFAAKVAEQPILRATPTRAPVTDIGLATVPRGPNWILMLAIAAVGLAVLLAGAAFLLWRQRHTGVENGTPPSADERG